MFQYDRLKKMRILLVDDNADLMDTIRLGFAAKGLSLTGVCSSKEALDLIKAQDYDIIITDYKMEGIDGLEFLRRIRELPGNPIKVMISAFGTDDVMSQAYDLGIDDFVPKPFGNRSIEDSLIKILEDRDNAQQAVHE